MEKVTTNRVKSGSVVLRLTGRTQLTEGRQVGAELNALIAYYNTMFLRGKPGQPPKMSSVTAAPQGGS